MPRKKQITFWACDFETTVWGEKVEQEKGKKQDSTEVWSAADVALYDNTETVTITHSIRDFLNRFLTMKGNNILYFHNLAFDGSFIIDFLLKEGWEWVHCKDKEMRITPPGTICGQRIRIVNPKLTSFNITASTRLGDFKMNIGFAEGE